MQSAEFRHDTLAEFSKVRQAVISYPVVLDVTPNAVDRVQLWGIRWKWHSNYFWMCSKVVVHGFSTMNQDCIPYQYDGAANLAAHIFNKLHHGVSVKIGVVF